MLFKSLVLTDVVQLVILCALIFIPLGFFINKKLPLVKDFLIAITKFKSNLKDCGSFSLYLSKTDNDKKQD